MSASIHPPAPPHDPRKDSLITYPSRFPIKVMGAKVDGFVHAVTQIARQMGNSKRRLERHFRAALDTSPQAAFLDIRLSFARHLVESTDKSIATIAVECGFCDSSHLSRMFRRRFGCTPFEIRKAQPAGYT